MAKFFIDRPVLGVVISAVILLAGLAAVNILPIAQYPEITPPTRPGLVLIPRSQRDRRPRHGRRSDRAAGQRRRTHAVHVVAEHERRRLQPDGDVRAGDEPRHGSGARAEPRQPGDALAARRGQGDRRFHQEEVAQHPARREFHLGRRSGHEEAAVRSALSEQLRHDSNPRRPRAAQRRGRRRLHGPAGLQHAALAGSRKAGVEQPHSQRRRQRAERTKRPGGSRTDRTAAGPDRAGLSVHAQHVGPARRGRAVRADRGEDRSLGPGRPS